MINCIGDKLLKGGVIFMRGAFDISPWHISQDDEQSKYYSLKLGAKPSSRSNLGSLMGKQESFLPSVN